MSRRATAEAIADTICPPWRRDHKAGDADVWDDIPSTNWDPATLKWNKAAESNLTFHVWELTKDKGLIAKLRVSFGDKATREYDRSGLGHWSFFGDEERIFVQAWLNPTATPVPGPQTKMKTTANRIKNEIFDAIIGHYRKTGAAVLPTVRVNVTEKKK